MKKKSIINNNEIDLIELIEIFWNEKIKIIGFETDTNVYIIEFQNPRFWTFKFIIPC